MPQKFQHVGQCPEGILASKVVHGLNPPGVALGAADFQVAAWADEKRIAFPQQLAAFGHMGREDLGVEWEKTNRIEELKKAL